MTTTRPRSEVCRRLGLLIFVLAARASSSAFTSSPSPLTLNDDVPYSQGIRPLHRRFHDNTRGNGDHHGIRSVLKESLSGGRETERSLSLRVKSLLQKNFLLVGMTCAVTLARLFPGLGTNGGILRPELFIGKFGVTLIFLLSGLSLEVSELKGAFSNIKLNTSIQLVTFAVWPFLVGFPLTQAMKNFFPTILPAPLLDGLLILTCLPTTVNMCVILTSSAGGSVASALCNAVISNIAGILLTPALILRFFGTQVQLPFLEMVWKLVNKVMLPVAVGQALRLTRAKDVYKAHSKKFKMVQELVMISILWNAFCEAFSIGWGMQFSHAVKLLLILPVLHLASLGFCFKLFEQIGFSRGEVVAAMFCASHKTLAFGLPLVNTIFEGNPNLATYCAPLMFIHPVQLILGSLFMSRLEKYTLGE